MARLPGSFIESLKNRHSAILGMTRSGKTYFTGHVLEMLQEQGAHTIFVDPKHDREYARLGTICHSAIEVYSQLLKKNRAIVFRPSAVRDERNAELDKLVEMMMELQRTDGFRRIRRVIAIDEIQLFVGKGSKSRAVEIIWTVGAGIGMMGIALTQRLQNLNEDIWSQSENKVCFKMDERPEYLKSRNLEHYPQEYLMDDMNKYSFYATTGGGTWKRYKPITIQIESNKSRDHLRLSRW